MLFLVNLVEDEVDGVFLDAEVRSVFVTGHLLYLQATNHPDNLELTLLPSPHRLFDAHLPTRNSILQILLYLDQKVVEQIAIELTLAKDILVLGRNCLQMSDKDVVELKLHILTIDCPQIMRKDVIEAFQADVSHDLQKLLKELDWLQLPLAELASRGIELGKLLVGKDGLQSGLEIFVVYL